MELPLRAGNRGAFLLEAVIAVTIASIALSGLAVSLVRCADASLALEKDNRLRGALENRLAEISAPQQPDVGESTFVAGEGKIAISQQIARTEIRDQFGETLTGIYEVHLKAEFTGENWPPMQVTKLLYRP